MRIIEWLRRKICPPGSPEVIEADDNEHGRFSGIGTEWLRKQISPPVPAEVIEADNEDDADNEEYWPFSGFSTLWALSHDATEISRAQKHYVAGGHHSLTLGKLLEHYGTKQGQVFAGFTSLTLLRELRRFGINTAQAADHPWARSLRAADGFALVFEKSAATDAAAILSRLTEEELTIKDYGVYRILGRSHTIRPHVEYLTNWLSSINDNQIGLWSVDCIRCSRIEDYCCASGLVDDKPQAQSSGLDASPGSM